MTEASLLADLPGWAFALGLLIARAGCACMLLPGIGEAETPAPIRAGCALGLALLLLPVLGPRMPPVPDDGWMAARMVLAEVGTGLMLGWLTRLVLMALPLAGQFIATMIGLASVLQPDPTLGASTTALARVLGLAAPALVLASGLHALPLAALAGSYDMVPAGALLPAADSADAAIAAASSCFAFALRLAAPFVLAATVWQVALALLARLVPHLQVWFVAMPGQIIAGLLLLMVMAAPLVEAWLAGARAGLAALPGL